jgi:uncharacterized protein YecE (DUF72 family)
MIVVGTSSWADPGFVEEWYPPDLPARERLSWYAEHFEAVEVNSTFYAVPAGSTVARWAEITPDDFTFDVKLHRVLSRHSAPPDSLPRDLRKRAKTTERGRVKLDKRLCDALCDATLEAVEPLVEAGKLGALLLQLSPAFRPRDERLDALAPLVQRLAPHPVAIELRHRGWLDDRRRERTLGWMAEHGAVWVCTDAPESAKHVTVMPPVDAVTRDGLAYFRAHGRNLEGYTRGRTVAERFAHRYTDEELGEIKERAQWLAEQAGPDGAVHLMFNNNRGSDAPLAAERMRELLGRAVSASG